MASLKPGTKRAKFHSCDRKPQKLNCKDFHGQFFLQIVHEFDYNILSKIVDRNRPWDVE